ncbi:MAG: carboxylating nicotinate-nucleotide diphosphorylase [Planctomycetota bacterium]
MYESELTQVLKSAVVEDLGGGDVTSKAVIPKHLRVKGHYLVKAKGVVAGLGLLSRVFRAFGPGVRLRQLVRDGAKVSPGRKIASITGPARTVLAGERLSLNLLCHLSGIATLTARFVTETRGTRARIFDTRKTTPGLRHLEKYAVAAGGGANHRMGLFDQVLIKDNHLALAKITPGEAVRIAAGRARRPIEVEVTSLAGMEEAIAAGADVVMLDNFGPARVARAVKRARNVARRLRRKVEIEVSGGVTLRNVRRYALANPDRISIGALTHSAPALDISLELERA